MFLLRYRSQGLGDWPDDSLVISFWLTLDHYHQFATPPFSLLSFVHCHKFYYATPTLATKLSILSCGLSGPRYGEALMKVLSPYTPHPIHIADELSPSSLVEATNPHRSEIL